MKVLIIGNGISGLYAAYKLAQKNIDVILASPTIPDRCQSVMAAGGINAAVDTMGENDSVDLHIKETIESGKYIEDEEMVRRLCEDAPYIVKELSDMGVFFNRTEDGEFLLRSFGGQSKKRTAFSGAATGKQIVSALSRNIRKYQASGKIETILNYRFLKGIIYNGVCYGGLFLDTNDNTVHAVTADKTIMATGGLNRLFGKTTGSTLCDGLAAAVLFTQGVTLKNLEFIQYHPTTIETPAKRMLISEAARGEGGRLFCLNEDGTRCYFLEEKYGKNGNLMTRDVISSEMEKIGKDVYLDLTCIPENVIKERLQEIDSLCLDYLNLDVTKEPVPVAPSVHFFMGGIAVDINHKTNIDGLFAIGECASAYHGANRLGGNSLLAAMHSAKVAADEIEKEDGSAVSEEIIKYFKNDVETISNNIAKRNEERSKYPAIYIMEEIASIMKKDLGIVRNEKDITSGLESIEFYTSVVSKLSFDGTVSPYEGYSLPYLLILSEAVLTSALNRKETRGAHIRSDYPDSDINYKKTTFVRYNNGKIITEV